MTYPRPDYQRSWVRKRFDKTSDVAATLIILLGVLTIWEMQFRLEWVNPILTSGPSEVLAALGAYITSDTFFVDVKATGIVILAGYALAVVVGLLCGFAMGWWSRLGNIFDPYVSFLYAAPRVAFIPIIVVWLGIGSATRVAVVFLMSVFPVLINAVAGVRSVDQQLIRVSKAFGGTTQQILRSVVMPSAVPSIIAGLRLALGLTFVGAIVAELYISSAGLGFRLFRAGQLFQIDLVFAVLILVAGTGATFTYLLIRLERHLGRWR